MAAQRIAADRTNDAVPAMGLWSGKNNRHHCRRRSRCY
jgi:hypothetical protein